MTNSHAFMTNNHAFMTNNSHAFMTNNHACILHLVCSYLLPRPPLQQQQVPAVRHPAVIQDRGRRT